MRGEMRDNYMFLFGPIWHSDFHYFFCDAPLAQKKLVISFRAFGVRLGGGGPLAQYL